MKKTLIAFSVTIMLSIALLLGIGLTACDWFNTSLLGKPGEDALKQKEAESARYLARMDSIATAETNAKYNDLKNIRGLKPNDKAYHLVVGCYSDQVNLDKMHAVLIKNSYRPYVFRNNGYICVSAISYDTREEAQNALLKFKKEHSFCPNDAWIYFRQK